MFSVTRDLILPGFNILKDGGKKHGYEFCMTPLVYKCSLYMVSRVNNGLLCLRSAYCSYDFRLLGTL